MPPRCPVAALASVTSRPPAQADRPAGHRRGGGPDLGRTHLGHPRRPGDALLAGAQAAGALRRSSAGTWSAGVPAPGGSGCSATPARRAKAGAGIGRGACSTCAARARRGAMREIAALHRRLPARGSATALGPDPTATASWPTSPAPCRRWRTALPPLAIGKDWLPTGRLLAAGAERHRLAAVAAGPRRHPGGGGGGHRDQPGRPGLRLPRRSAWAAAAGAGHRAPRIRPSRALTGRSAQPARLRFGQQSAAQRRSA